MQLFSSLHVLTCASPPPFLFEMGRKLSDDLAPDPGGIKAAEATNLEECLAQHQEALQKVLPVGLVYGNASKDDAKRIWKTVSETERGEGREGGREREMRRRESRRGMGEEEGGRESRDGMGWGGGERENEIERTADTGRCEGRHARVWEPRSTRLCRTVCAFSEPWWFSGAGARRDPQRKVARLRGHAIRLRETRKGKGSNQPKHSKTKTPNHLLIQFYSYVDRSTLLDLRVQRNHARRGRQRTSRNSSNSRTTDKLPPSSRSFFIYLAPTTNLSPSPALSPSAGVNSIRRGRGGGGGGCR